ncbi:MAG: glycosyltransferase [Phycisphaeraceae bacterium]|nr:glycosyltransferase [Phycisphaeraceae bacterium]
MNTTPDYAIIIPAYNEAAQLPCTLPAIREAMAGVSATGELIVVDNNSTDDTAAIATQHSAKVVFEPINMIAKARNAGAKAAIAPTLIFIDADTTPSAELLNAALDELKKSDCVGGGAVVQLEPPPSWLTRRLAGCWNILSRVMGYPAGCFVFCRKEAFDEVEGFGENLYASEEIWLARRLKRWGKSQKPKQRMRVLPVPIVTSSRKMDNGPQMYGMLLLMFIFPFAVRFKRLCGYWYKRENA